LTAEQRVDELIEAFMNGQDHTEQLERYDTELHNVPSVYVSATPLPHERGRDMYECPLVDVLLLRLNDLRRAVPEAMSFLSRRVMLSQHHPRCVDSQTRHLAQLSAEER
jgi:hypothetical protein